MLAETTRQIGSVHDVEVVVFDGEENVYAVRESVFGGNDMDNDTS